MLPNRGQHLGNDGERSVVLGSCLDGNLQLGMLGVGQPRHHCRECPCGLWCAQLCGALWPANYYPRRARLSSMLVYSASCTCSSVRQGAASAVQSQQGCPY